MRYQFNIIVNVSIHGTMENGTNMMPVRIESTLLNAHAVTSTQHTTYETRNEMNNLFIAFFNVLKQIRNALKWI